LWTVDIAEFTRADRDDAVRLHLHESLYRILEQAFDASGIPWSACFTEDRGDGVLAIIPPSFGARATIDPLPEKLRTLIRRHNHVSSAEARIQLRVAVHIGPVDNDGHGFIGSDLNFLCRMLDARSFKAELAKAGAELACIVSEDVYRTIVCRHPDMVSPDDFRLVRFQVKRTRGRAYIYLPGAPRSLMQAAPRHHQLQLVTSHGHLREDGE
jgi:hypothetical protein